MDSTYPRVVAVVRDLRINCVARAQSLSLTVLEYQSVNPLTRKARCRKITIVARLNRTKPMVRGSGVGFALYKISPVIGFVVEVSRYTVNAISNESIMTFPDKSR